MISLIVNNLLRRPIRTSLTIGGVAMATAVLVCMLGFGTGYERSLRTELTRTGVQMMLVPLGCPYDAAARVLKNQTLESSLPASALEIARNDQAVAVAAPLLLAALPRQNDRRTDLWVGLDEAALSLKPWWHAQQGDAWFRGSNDIILGADAALLEMRSSGDKLYSPEMRRKSRVAGILKRSGTSDDSAFFVPLATAQSMFARDGRITAVALRLKDPVMMRDAAPRLQRIPGAQAVTMTEMMGTFLNLIGAVRTLVAAISIIALVVSALAVLNTMLASVVERTNEFAVMRAIGASRVHVFALLIAESVLLTTCGAIAGAGVAVGGGRFIEPLAKGILPFAPVETLLAISGTAVVVPMLAACVLGVIAAIYPAWRAARLAPALAAKGDQA
jgi:putative ABC transport system permease protein